MILRGLKQYYKVNLESLNDRLRQVNAMLLNDLDNNEEDSNYAEIYQYYKYQDISGKRYIIDLLTPSSINSNTGNIESLNINSALLKIFDLQSIKIQHTKNKISAIVASKGVKIDQAVKALKCNGIIVNEDQAKVILDFLYLLAKTCYKSNSTAA